MTTDIYAPIPYYGYTYSDGTTMKTCERDLQALELLRADLHAAFPNDYSDPLFIFQGCYHDGALSGGTHSGSSVYDLHPSDYAKKAELGAKHGIIVYHRPVNWDGKQGGEHCHCIIRGGTKISEAAHAQVLDWDKHLDGLYYHKPYTTGPWFPVKPFVYHQPKPPRQPPAPPPHDTLIDKWDQTTSDSRHAEDAAIADGEAFVAAQPHRPLLSAVLIRQKARAVEAAADRAVVHEAANP